MNPVSGKNIEIDFVNDLIVPACEKLGVAYEVYETKAAGDGIRFVDETAAKMGDRPCRFYAVGGDGTLYEIVNGAYGHANAEVGVVPKGSGNDWIRLFGDIELFRNVEAQLKGTPHKVDCLKVNGDEIAINQCSIGFDAEVCARQAAMKNVPGAVGHLTYLLAEALKKKKADFEHYEHDGPVSIHDFHLLAFTPGSHNCMMHVAKFLEEVAAE